MRRIHASSMTVTTTLIAPGCAFGFWHMWGVLKTRGVGSDENVCCISGSSLAMVVYLCDLHMEQQIDRCSRLRKKIHVCNMFRVVREWLECELPDDCHVKCNGKMTVLLRHPIRWTVHSFSHWYSKTDLIDCLLAACIPVLPSQFRGGWYMDCIDHTPTGTHTRLPRQVVLYIPTADQARALYSNGVCDGSKL